MTPLDPHQPSREEPLWKTHLALALDSSIGSEERFQAMRQLQNLCESEEVPHGEILRGLSRMVPEVIEKASRDKTHDRIWCQYFSVLSVLGAPSELLDRTAKPSVENDAVSPILRISALDALYKNDPLATAWYLRDVFDAICREQVGTRNCDAILNFLKAHVLELREEADYSKLRAALISELEDLELLPGVLSTSLSLEGVDLDDLDEVVGAFDELVESGRFEEEPATRNFQRFVEASIALRQLLEANE